MCRAPPSTQADGPWHTLPISGNLTPTFTPLPLHHPRALYTDRAKGGSLGLTLEQKCIIPGVMQLPECRTGSGRGEFHFPWRTRAFLRRHWAAASYHGLVKPAKSPTPQQLPSRNTKEAAPQFMLQGALKAILTRRII